MMLKTERLIIRRIAEDDWRAVKAIWESEKQSPYAQYDRPNDTEEGAVRKRIAKWAAFSSSTEHMFFAVCLQATVIGYIAFNIRDHGYEVGYCFHSDYHRKGYARESLSALVKHIQAQGATVRLSAGTALHNLPSVRLLTSLGFKQIGTEQVSFYQDADGADIIFDGGIFELNL